MADEEKTTTSSTDHDQLFKVLIRNFFKDFMRLFLPDEAKLINFRKVTFLDKEEFTDINKGQKKVMDLVVKVGLKTGGEEFILIHNEFESSKPTDFKLFSERMYKYQCLLFLRYSKPVIPVVIFSDDQKWRSVPEGNYNIEVAGKRYVDFNYHLIKLKNRNWREFMEYNNPLAYALMAKMELDKKSRAKLKMEFLRMVLRCGVNEARKGVLLNFIEKYVILNNEESKVYERLAKADEQYKEVRKMITVYEERGQLKSKKEDILKVLGKKFKKNIPYTFKEKVKYCDDLAELDVLFDKALDAQSIEDIKF